MTLNLFRCRRCLYPNTKPDLWFDEHGICSACLAFDKRKTIDWAAREREFRELVHKNRGKSHDVIVAVSGGKDSHWQVIKCLELGIRPLAVCATTDHLSALGRKNLDNIANLCDLVEVTPHKPTRRKISKFALQEVGDISWCEHHLIWSVPAREAVQREIPIVLYGECPQNEYGAGPKGSEAQDRLTEAWVHEFGGLLGLRLSDLSEILDIDPRHLDVYRFPSPAVGVQAVFMGAYFEWDGLRNAEIARERGFEWWHDRVEGTGHRYENLDNLQTGIHDYLRFLKFGYGRTCDIVSNHIRRGRMSHDEAATMALHCDGVKPAYYLGEPLMYILAEIGMSCAEFYEICERFTNREVVAWASQSASFRHFSGTDETAASKESSSTPTGASAASPIESAYLSAGT